MKNHLSKEKSLEDFMSKQRELCFCVVFHARLTNFAVMENPPYGEIKKLIEKVNHSAYDLRHAVPDGFYDIEHAAYELSIDSAEITRGIRRGDLRAYKFNLKKRYVFLPEVESFIFEFGIKHIGDNENK